MFSKALAMATIPVQNLSRAKKFYAEVLGLTPGKAFPNGIRMQAGGKTTVALYHRPPTNRDHTMAWFTVTDFDKTAADLQAKGVKFNHYDMPGFDSLEKGIYRFGTTKLGWFNDSEGNILCISGDW